MNRLKPNLPRFILSTIAAVKERFQLFKSLIINYQQVKPLAIALGTGLLFLLGYFFCLPRPLFNAPISQVVEDRAGELLSARIAADGAVAVPCSR